MRQYPQVKTPAQEVSGISFTQRLRFASMINTKVKQKKKEFDRAVKEAEQKIDKDVANRKTKPLPKLNTK